MENLHESPADCKPRITALAQLVALYAECRGVTSTAELVAATGYTERAIRKAKAELGCRNQGAAGTRVPEPQCRTRNQGAVSEPQCRNQGAALVRANTEIPTGLVITKNLESHSHTEQAAERARVGEEEIAPGLFVNCKTIRHRAFAINVDAVRMASQAAGWTKDETKDFCVANAMQWATEIDNGKLPREVVPDKIANFLGASIMGAKNRKAAADTRATHKGGRPSTSDMIGRALARREAAI